VNAISQANLEDAKELATEKIQQKIKRIPILCQKSETTTLADIAIPILNTMDQKERSGSYDKELNSYIQTFEKELKSVKQKFQTKMKAKYGSHTDISKVNREEVLNEGMKLFVEASTPLIEKEFELFDIKTKREKEVKKIAALFRISGRTKVTYGNLNKLKGIVGKVLTENGSKPTPQCIDKLTKYGNIDDISIIEVITHAPDRSEVRLELVREDGKSKKVSIDVEKIQKEWKVSHMYLRTFF